MQAALSYTGELTRRYDRNRYLCSLFALPEMREAWFAIFAFHHEIAHIADTVGEEMVGFVRYAWWRETVTAIYSGKPPRGHPVAEALAQHVTQLNLPKALFDTIIDAHEQALAEKKELDEGFLAATAGAVMELCGAAAGNREKSVRSLGIALAAIEAAMRRSMDPDHRAYFIKLAQEHLDQTEALPTIFAPFLHTARFYLRRVEKGRISASRIWLPFMLWRKAICG